MAYNSSWKSPNFTKPVLTLIFLSKQQILNFLSVFSIRKIINLKTLREKSTFHNGAIIIWIKYTGTIQISPEPRLFSISTIYNAFNFIFYPTLSIFYITTIIIFVWGVAHTPCVSGCWRPDRGAPPGPRSPRGGPPYRITPRSGTVLFSAAFGCVGLGWIAEQHQFQERLVVRRDYT